MLLPPNKSLRQPVVFCPPFPISLLEAGTLGGLKRRNIPMRRLHFALLSLVLVLAAQPLFATTYYVSTNQPPVPCASEKSGWVVFPSIQYAVTHVPEGATINICPGTYSEQVTISRPLTLQGVSYGNSSHVVIAMPGALTTTPSLLFGTVAAQVEVTAGPVNVTGITVDGTASSSNCPSGWYVGIFYSSGSSGTVNGVQARYQNCNFVNGVGILAENGHDPSKSVTIKNSYIHDNGEDGLAAYGASLTASMEHNDVEDEVVAIFQQAADGSVSGNTVINASTAGIVVYAGVVSDNTVGGVSILTAGGGTITYTDDDGIDVYGASTVTSNHISNSTYYGIRLLTGGATITSNIITSNGLNEGGLEFPVGIGFGCFTNTVSGNAINGTATGIEFVPAAFKGVNAFYSVPTINYEGGGGC
jgi:hypothetical protein